MWPKQEHEGEEDDAEQPPFREAGPLDERKRIGAGELVEDREVLDDVGRPGCGSGSGRESSWRIARFSTTSAAPAAAATSATPG